MNILKKMGRAQVPLYYKMTFSFVALFLVLLIALGFTNDIIMNTVRSYMDEQMENRYEVAIEALESSIEENDWHVEDEAFHQLLERYADSSGFLIELLDNEHNVVFEAEDRGRPQNKPDAEYEREYTKFRGVEPKFIEKEIALEVEDQIYGYIKVRFFDVSVMKPGDLQLFVTVQNIFRVLILAVMFIILILSFFIARSITRPLKKIGMTANAISQGRLDARAELDTNTKELLELSRDINTLAGKLEQEDILRSQVTSDMAHEIRTPLTSLRNFFEAFLDGVYEVNEENLEKCHSEILRMSELVDRLKDIASIEELTVRAKRGTVDLSAECRAMCELSRPAFDSKDIELNVHIPEICQVNMDPAHFRQTISNLITNGLRYTDEGGYVMVSVERDDNCIIVSVADNGIGMNEEDASKIFERFYRADKSRDRASGGLGVGLTIVKKMVEFYGGTISLETELGKGSVFTIKYPISEVGFL